MSGKFRKGDAVTINGKKYLIRKMRPVCESQPDTNILEKGDYGGLILDTEATGSIKIGNIVVR
jgi:hypothetical protein